MRPVSGSSRHSMAALVCLVAFATLTLLSPSFADVVKVGDRMYLDGYIGGQATGPLSAHPILPSDFPTFKTFCTELEEVIYVNGGPNYDYYVDKIGTKTDVGNRNLTDHAAWLYTAYLKGELFNYQDDNAHNNAIQYGIWTSLGYTDDTIAAHGFNAAQFDADYHAYGWDTTPAGWSGLGQVRIANLRSHDAQGVTAQDMLVSVPEPASAMLFALPATFWLCSRRRRAC